MEQLKDKLKKVRVKGKDDNLEEKRKTKVVVNLSSYEDLIKNVIIHNKSTGIDSCMDELKDKLKRVKVKRKDDKSEERKKTKVVVDLS